MKSRRSSIMWSMACDVMKDQVKRDMEADFVTRLVDGLSNDKEADRWHTACYKKLTPELLNIALADPSRLVRRRAIRHPNVQAENIELALKDNDLDVRKTAASRHTITPELLWKALNDKEYSVRLSAIGNPKLTAEHIQWLLRNEKDPRVVLR